LKALLFGCLAAAWDLPGVAAAFPRDPRIDEG
jgi:hypothetical protein